MRTNVEIPEERVREGLGAVGSLDEKAARRLQESAENIRATWRCRHFDRLPDLRLADA